MTRTVVTASCFFLARSIWVLPSFFQSEFATQLLVARLNWTGARIIQKPLSNDGLVWPISSAWGQQSCHARVFQPAQNRCPRHLATHSFLIPRSTNEELPLDDGALESTEFATSLHGNEPNSDRAFSLENSNHARSPIPLLISIDAVDFARDFFHGCAT